MGTEGIGDEEPGEGHSTDASRWNRISRTLFLLSLLGPTRQHGIPPVSQCQHVEEQSWHWLWPVPWNGI